MARQGRRRGAWLALAAAVAAGGGLGSGGAAAAEPPSADRLHVGIYPEEIDPAVVDAVSAWGGGAPLTFTGLFHHVDEAMTAARLEAAWAAGTTPVANVLYFDTARSMLDGRDSSTGLPNDVEARIERWAGEVERFLDRSGDRSALLVPMPEMNGEWTSYGCVVAGAEVEDGAADYRAAFRKFRSIVDARLGALAARVRWVFAPNNRSGAGCASIADYYPGAEAVDLIGVSAFNQSGLEGRSWSGVTELLEAPLDELRSTVDAAKPFLVSQTASNSTGGDKDGWIADLFAYLTDDPNVVGFVWFNIDGGGIDYSCCPDDRYPAWQEGMAQPATAYTWPLDWFGGGPLPFTPAPRPPLARDDAAVVDEGGVVVVGVTANDRDPNLDPLTVALATPPAHGTAVVDAHGAVTYSHDASESTGDAFTYSVTDGRFTSHAAVSITVRQRPDAAVGLVDPEEAQWHVRSADGAVRSFYFGNPGDVPIRGDWDCDGVDTPGLYRKSDGFVYLRNSNDTGIADVRFFFGDPDDVPLAGDFDGDGCDTVSVYRASDGRVFISNHLGEGDRGLGLAAAAYYFGDPGDKPFAGDFDGDGVATVGLHRETTGLVYLRQSHTPGPADVQFVFGDPGDRVVAGDWTGNGVDAVGLFRPGDATFYLRHASGSGAADESIPFGSAGWLPVAGVP